MKSVLKVSLAALTLAFAVSSHAADKKLVVATDTAFVPFEFKQGDKYVGFDVDLWAAIAKELKLDYELKPMDFSGIIPALQTKNVDLALAGITITDERKKAIDFSDGYYKSGLLVMVKANNNDVKSVKDLDGKVVAVKSGTGSVDYAKANIKTKDLRQFPNIDNAYMELGTNRADAVLHDTPNILYFIKTAGNGQFKAVGDSLEAQQYGIAFPKGSDELRDKVKNERYGVAPSVAFGLGTANRLYLNYLHVTQHNTPDGGIPTIGLPGYSAPSAGTAALNHSGKVDTHNFYGTDSDYDDSTTDTATMRFEHDINDNTTIRNTTRWSRVKQDYLMTAIMGGASNITQPTSDVNSWTWSRTANTKDVSNKILTNQTNLTSTFYTGSIGHDVSTGVEFTRETQTNYGVNPVTLPAVNIYHPDSSIHPGGLTRNGANANGQTDTFAIYAFDTLQITRDFELNGGIRLDNYHTEYDSATACGGSGRGAITCPTGVAKGSPVTTVDTAKSGNLMNWKAGALYHLTENGNVYINYAVSQQPPGGNNFALAQSGSGNSANRTDFKPQKANTSEIGTKWQVLDKRLLLTAALFRTDIENEVEQNDDGTYSQYGKKRVEGYEISVAGNITPAWQVIGGYTQQKATIKNGKDVAQDGSSSLPYTPEHAFTLWSQYQATDDISVGAGARYIGSMHKGSDGAVGTPAFTEGYWVADAKLGYRVNRNLDFQLNVYNLFDTDYVASINKSGYRYHPGEPRTFLLTANMHF